MRKKDGIDNKILVQSWLLFLYSSEGQYLYDGIKFNNRTRVADKKKFLSDIGSCKQESFARPTFFLEIF
jgi:hypothetical protein